MLDEILIARLHTGAPRASTSLHAVGGYRRALHVSGMAYCDRGLLVRDQVFELNLGGFVFNVGARRVAALRSDVFPFCHNHTARLVHWSQSGVELRNILEGNATFRAVCMD